MTRRHYHNFSFEPPTDWNDRSTILWVSPARYEMTSEQTKQELPRENFVVERQKRKLSDTDPVAYLQALVGNLQQGLENFKELESVSPHSLCGCEGAKVAYSLLMEEMTVRQNHMILFVEDSVLHLIATATLSRYPHISATFEEILQSFRLD